MMKNDLVCERNHTLNYLKALASFCVVMLHCGFPGIAGKLIYGPARFAVPFFFMVSGYYVYSEDREKVINGLPRKIKHIALLLIETELIYLVWHIIQNAIGGGWGSVETWFSDTFSVSKLIRFLIFQTTPIGDVSWFLVALLICYLATYGIAYFNLWGITAVFIPILLGVNIFLGEIAPFFGIDTQWYWCSNFWMLGFPYYAMGYWIKRNQNSFGNRCTARNIVFVVILSVLLITVERIMTNASQLFIGNIPLVMILFMFCIKYPYKLPKNRNIDSIADKYSFHIYILHPIIRDVYGKVFEVLGLNNNTVILWIRPIVVFLLSLICAYVFKLTFERRKTIAKR